MNILAQQPNNIEQVNQLDIPSIYEYLSELISQLSNQNDIKVVQDYLNNIDQISTNAKIVIKNYCDEHGNVIVPNGPDANQVIEIKQLYSTLYNLSLQCTANSAKVYTIIQLIDRNTTTQDVNQKFCKDLPELNKEIQNALSFLLTLESMYRSN